MEPERIIASKYVLGRKIGSGTFGVIYAGTDIQTQEKVAVKCENQNTDHPTLPHESELYRVLQGGTGIPRMRWSGKVGNENVLVIDRLGESLEDLFEVCNKKFSLKSVLMLADQMIERVEFLHSNSYVHQDIKPSNFLMGQRRNKANQQVYLIDFGLAKKYRNLYTHSHIPYREKRRFIGTLRYASRNAHLGIEQSRRDDLESIGYCLIYFLRGSLPWQGLSAASEAEKKKLVHQKKLSISAEALCSGYPKEFAMYFNYCSCLRFEDTPNYGRLRKWFRDAFARQGFMLDYVFDWNILRNQRLPGPARPIVSHETRDEHNGKIDLVLSRRPLQLQQALHDLPRDEYVRWLGSFALRIARPTQQQPPVLLQKKKKVHASSSVRRTKSTNALAELMQSCGIDLIS